MPVERIIRFFTSLRLTVACLVIGIVLIFWGTLAQVDLGLYKAQNEFFRSFFIYWRPHFAKLRIPIFPGGYLVGSVGNAARSASYATAKASTAAKNAALLEMARAVRERRDELLSANGADIELRVPVMVRALYAAFLARHARAAGQHQLHEGRALAVGEAHRHPVADRGKVGLAGGAMPQAAGRLRRAPNLRSSIRNNSRSITPIAPRTHTSCALKIAAG